MLIVMQGPSGSGKSTRARELRREHRAVIVSADDWRYTSKGVYVYMPSENAAIHAKCREAAVNYLSQHRNVILDNTNLTVEHVRPYVQAAVRYGHEVLFVRCHGTFANLHGVTPDVVARQLAAMEELTVEACLAESADAVQF